MTVLLEIHSTLTKEAEKEKNDIYQKSFLILEAPQLCGGRTLDVHIRTTVHLCIYSYMYTSTSLGGVQCTTCWKNALNLYSLVALSFPLTGAANRADDADGASIEPGSG